MQAEFFVCLSCGEYLCITIKVQRVFAMKRKDNNKKVTNENVNFGNPELELKLMENELFGWLISSAYQSYSLEGIQIKKRKTKNNRSKKINNKK